LIAEQAQRLGLTCIRTTVGDAAEPEGRYAAESMDLVLLDAPCSGFGVIRRKPEIKWTKSPEDVAAIAEIQHKLLDAAAALLRPGGVMIYSTCTIERMENEDQISRFLAEHPEFSLDRNWPAAVLEPLKKSGIIDGEFTGALQLLPQHFGSDGFFIARLRKQP
jgi:16S rRNA (cytosine967-C5)-methyltransferase